ncbi:MAG TPA: DUF2281 domain-containing protein [Promineifilum sp.]|nr:DUF2281 domain-containing protein [Promineifilum sp.]
MNFMIQSGMVRKRIRQAIDALPPTAQTELVQFIEYLQYKYSSPETRLASLGGTWADIELDITQDDVRAVREQTGDYLASRAWTDELPR